MQNIKIDYSNTNNTGLDESQKNATTNVNTHPSDQSRVLDSKKVHDYENATQLTLHERSCDQTQTFKEQFQNKIKNAPLRTAISQKKDIEVNKQHLSLVEKEIKKRWESLKKIYENTYNKSNFDLYNNQKSDDELKADYKKLNEFRNLLWFTNPNESDFAKFNHRDDFTRESLNNDTSTQRTLPFQYNCPNHSYNASTILIKGYHFIGLREPNRENYANFVQLLTDQNICMLVRVNQKEEFLKRNPSLTYWEEPFVTNCDGKIAFNFMNEGFLEKSDPIYYFDTEEWLDFEGVDLKVFYNLIETVRNTWKKIENPGPIACHCFGGLGRTGTFFAGLVIANSLDKIDLNDISIEEVVLYLSIQRPFMVGSAEQYLLLHKFAAYYFEKKSQKSIV